MRKKILCLIFIFIWIYQPTIGQCVTNVSGTLNFVSSSGANCTFSFTPSAIINSSPNVKMVEFTLPSGSSPSSVCYSGNPIAQVPCTGGYTAINNNSTLITLPSATIIMPCNVSTINFTAQTASSGSGGQCAGPSSVSIAGASPVKLSYFKAMTNPNEVVLTWQTEVETNSSHFVVQRSGNALEFGDLETIKTAGESSEKTNYRFIDKKPLSGLNYYRLRQVDNDGSSTFSKIIDVDSEGGVSETIIHPNPSEGSFMIKTKEPILWSEAYNSTGKNIEIKLIQQGNSYSVDFGKTPQSGLYFLKVKTQSGITNYRVVIQ